MNALEKYRWAQTVEGLQNDPRLTPEMRRATFPAVPKILGASAKVKKGAKIGILTAIAYLAPSTESGRDMCPWATAECAAACLGHSSGQLIFDTSRNSRIWKTALFLYARNVFDAILDKEISALARKAKKLGLQPAVRLNGTTDVIPAWEFAKRHPDLTFYDYTKSYKRAKHDTLPENYHLTFSFSGRNRWECEKILAAGGNVAIIFDKLPETFLGVPVIDADVTDARFTDPAGTIAGLKFKGNKIASAGDFLVKVGS